MCIFLTQLLEDLNVNVNNMRLLHFFCFSFILRPSSSTSLYHYFCAILFSFNYYQLLIRLAEVLVGGRSLYSLVPTVYTCRVDVNGNPSERTENFNDTAIAFGKFKFLKAGQTKRTKNTKRFTTIIYSGLTICKQLRLN